MRAALDEVTAVHRRAASQFAANRADFAANAGRLPPAERALAQTALNQQGAALADMSRGLNQLEQLVGAGGYLGALGFPPAVVAGLVLGAMTITVLGVFGLSHFINAVATFTDQQRRLNLAFFCLQSGTCKAEDIKEILDRPNGQGPPFALSPTLWVLGSVVVASAFIWANNRD